MDQNVVTAFFVGLGIGALFTVYTWWKGWLARRPLLTEIQRLKEHLHSHMEIAHEGNAQRKDELERLRRENENLRITVRAWQQKPDRRELRTLHVYDQAARALMKSAPGFAPHWETALENAERVIAEEDRGLLAFARRLVLPKRRIGPPHEVEE
jgi:hypothetical protein